MCVSVGLSLNGTSLRIMPPRFPRFAAPVDQLTEPEDGSEPWTQIQPTSTPANFCRDFLVVSIIVHEALLALMPQLDREDAFRAICCVVRRDHIHNVIVDDFKRLFSRLLWSRCNFWHGSARLRVFYQNASAVVPRPDRVQIPYDWSLGEIRREFPSRPRVNIPMSWHTILIPETEPATIFFAPSGTELMFLHMDIAEGFDRY